jgi:C4-dicarboxylate-specific signal transduction histidine kinase
VTTPSILTLSNDWAPQAPARAPRRALLGFVFTLLAIVFIAAIAGFGFTFSEAQGIAAQRRESSHRLELFASTVQAVVKRLEHVPPTVQLNHDVQALLTQPASRARAGAANTYLRQLNAYLGSLAVYVMNDRGVVVASSNDDRRDDSRVGQDLSFRPYFLDALSGRVGRHFAIGIDGNEPGYFVSHPIHDGAHVVGVAAIKISLEPINTLWETLGAPGLLADINQVVILSSNPAWRYTALAELPIERRVDLQLTRMYSNVRLARFPIPVKLAVDEESQVVETLLPPGGPPSRDVHAGTLVLGRTVDGMDWRLMMFSDLRPVRDQALVSATAAALGAGVLVLTAVFFVQRRRITRQRLAAKAMLERVNAELEQSVADRTQDLTDANRRLREEVAERAQTEQTLRATQGELVQAAKMAMLGQIATGITHELTQPLGAIRTLSGNAVEFMRRGQLDEVAGNLGIVARLADQMGSIIHPLKRFARKSHSISAPADVAQAMSNALFLYHPRLREEGVEVENHCVPGRAIAACEPNRLEQVLTNLIGNAIDAMTSAATRRLTLRATTEDAGEGGGRRVRIEVVDTGCGFSDEVGARFFEAFFTTKSSGKGLGLGLTISRDIVREFQGDLVATGSPGAGACFTVTLPAAEPSAAAAAAAAREEEVLT